MKIFTEKGIFKKLIIVLIAIIAFNAVIPTNVSFASDAASKVGGTLLSPVASLMIGLGDVVMNIIHDVLFDMDSSYLLIEKQNKILGIFLTILAALAAIVVVALVAYWLGGAALAWLGKMSLVAEGAKIGVTGLVTIAAVATKVGVVVGSLTALAWFGDNVVFPMYQISPAEIFKGEIALLDVNFFEKEPEITDKDIDTTNTFIGNKDSVLGNSIKIVFENTSYPEIETKLVVTLEDGTKQTTEDTVENLEKKANEIIKSTVSKYGYDVDVAKVTYNGVGTEEINVYKWSNNLDAYEARVKRTHGSLADEEEYTPEDNYTSTVIYTLDVFKGEWIGYEKTTLGITLSPTISKWYYAIRNFVLVVMMVILLYIGIRIILCGIASEKAKYKNMLTDWLVAICLVFVMHYIMVFAMNVVDGITNIFSTIGNSEERYINMYEIDDHIYNELESALAEMGQDIEDIVVKDGNGTVMRTEDGNNRVVSWNVGNIIGMARVRAALSEEGTITYIGWGMAFVILVCYTVFFLFTYLKRALYLTFFTIMAPLVAMTYPLDKMHDGKAQAFNMWFKEYVFNLMIQPVHLLLYTILIGTAFELASSNILYTLVALGFMMPAEKFIRKMFGFDKAQTPGFLSGAAGTALMVTGFNKMFNRKSSKGGRDDRGGSGEKSGKDDKLNLRDEKLMNQMTLTGETPEKSKPTNVLAPQVQKQQMQEALTRAQTPKLGQMDLNKYAAPGTFNKSSSNLGFNRTGNAQQQLQEQSKKLREAQAKEQAKQERKERWKNSFVGKRAGAMKAASKKYAQAKFKRLGEDIQNGKPIKDIARVAGGLYLGAGGALLGTTIGLASGEFKNVGQYATTLGAAGYAVGRRDLKLDSDIGDAYKEYERAKFGSEEEYRKHLLEEQRKAYAENEKYLEQLRTYLKLEDRDAAQEKMYEYGDFLDAGITDMEDFATAVKAVEDHGWSKEMAATASRYYKKAGGKPKNMGKRDRENIEFQYQNVVRANGITDDKQVQDTVRIMLANLDKYGSIKDSLTQL